MITIPGLERFNGSYYDAYKAIYSLVAYEVEELRSKFPEKAINSIDGYKVGILAKMMFASCSFMVIIEQTHDYSSAATILRSIADNLASYILVYHEKDKDELLLRHYLFLYDGLNTRLNGRLAIKPNSNPSIPKIEEEMRQKTIKEATTNDEKAIAFCLANIRSNNLYKKHNTEVEYLINHKKWNYISLEKYKERNTWGKMYPIIYGKESCSIFISYLSQFVHGLSSSNLIYEVNNNHTFNELIGIGITFLGKINDFAQNDFNIDKKALMHNFFQSEFGKVHLSYVTPEYLESFLKSIKL